LHCINQALKPETESSSGLGTSTCVQDTGPWTVGDSKQNVTWTRNVTRNFLDCCSRLCGWYIVYRCHFSSQKTKVAPCCLHELKFLSIALDILFSTLPGLFSMTRESLITQPSWTGHPLGTAPLPWFIFFFAPGRALLLSCPC